MILRGLLGMLGAWRMAPALNVVVYRRISAAFARIEWMLRRFRAGRLPGSRPRAQTPLDTKQLDAINRDAVVRLPQQVGWLIEAGGHEAAFVRSQVEDVLNTPEMRELLETSPQARRVLRPWCRALAIDVPSMTPPPKPPKEPKPRTPRPKPEPYRTKLPRGVISAARRYKALEKAKIRVRELAATMFRNVIKKP